MAIKNSPTISVSPSMLTTNHSNNNMFNPSQFSRPPPNFSKNTFGGEGGRMGGSRRMTQAGSSSSNNYGNAPQQQQRLPVHDKINFIGSGKGLNPSIPPSQLMVPIGMFMNMSHIPPRFYNQQQQVMSKHDEESKDHLRGKSQDGYSQSLMSGAALTQGGLSQGGDLHSGGLSQGFSQTDFSQDSILVSELQSQMEGMLSQDSTYQGGRLASQTGADFLSQ
eukprot:TRINITY_DN3436_c0_g1_i1.p1 TRINITY_DN3436_c0_g1~~TRINITY_DN3436_c0_g1_i1.p1  ORF type:complete len:221 (-),score=92.42 TRINITY_DN3436_c0_g1_i1:612-1274(-)